MLLLKASQDTFISRTNSTVDRLDQARDFVIHYAAKPSSFYGHTAVSGQATVHQGDQHNTHITNQFPAELLHQMQQHWEHSNLLRKKLLDDLSVREKDRQDTQFRSTLVWLQLADQEQEQETIFTRKADSREDHTGNWLLKNTHFVNWLDPDHKSKYLWLKGKPGSGNAFQSVQ